MLIISYTICCFNKNNRNNNIISPVSSDTIFHKVVLEMYEKDFSLRLAQLRNKKGISAREMSLSIGQNAGYINAIECGKALPAMSSFFYICEYLSITPAEFFDLNSKNPEKLQNILDDLKQLDDAQLENISSIIKGLIK